MTAAVTSGTVVVGTHVTRSKFANRPSPSRCLVQVITGTLAVGDAARHMVDGLKPAIMLVMSAKPSSSAALFGWRWRKSSA